LVSLIGIDFGRVIHGVSTIVLLIVDVIIVGGASNGQWAEVQKVKIGDG
jgi:hypothetical protein